MSAPAHWLSIIPLLLCSAGLLWLVWRDARESRRYELEHRRFLCPVQHQKVEATLVRAAASHRVIGVQTCSGAGAGDVVRCGRPCVPGFGPRRMQQATPA